MADIVVVGSLMIDLVSFTERTPKPGETIHGKSFVQNFGGKGANQCVAASRLGSSAAMVGKLGDDHFGTAYKDYLQQSGIRTECLDQISNSSSGIASIWVDGQGQNSIIITGNSNNKMTVQDVLAADKLLSRAKIVICQLEIPAQVSLFALQMAKKSGVRSIFNPAPATENLDPAFFDAIDILCANETEAELMVGFAVDSKDNCANACKKLVEMGVSTVVLTLGSKGAVFYSRGETEPQYVEVKPVTVVDSTGAGDAFVGALAHFLTKEPNSPLREHIRKACNYASDSVTKLGTQPSYARMEELSSGFFSS